MIITIIMVIMMFTLIIYFIKLRVKLVRSEWNVNMTKSKLKAFTDVNTHILWHQYTFKSIRHIKAHIYKHSLSVCSDSRGIAKFKNCTTPKSIDTKVISVKRYIIESIRCSFQIYNPTVIAFIKIIVSSDRTSKVWWYLNC